MVIELFVVALDELALAYILDLFVNGVAQVLFGKLRALLALELSELVLECLLGVLPLLELVIETLLDVADVGSEHCQRFVLHLELVVVPHKTLEVLRNGLLAVSALAGLGTQLDV